MTTNRLSDNALAGAVEAARSLSELRAVLDDDRWSEWDRQALDISSLPTYGGPEPECTLEIYSWDPEFYMQYSGSGEEGWTLTPRAEWDEWRRETAA